MPAVKQRIRARAGHRLNDDGTLLFVARAHRSQERNRADALERLRQLIIDSLEPPRPRKADAPDQGVEGTAAGGQGAPAAPQGTARPGARRRLTATA